MFLRNFPALVINDCLVIADVHIGITKELYHQGIAVPAQTKKMIDTLHKLKKTTQTKNLAILGDLKHSILKPSMYEEKEIYAFLEALHFKKIVITKGNHDGGLEKMVRGLQKVSIRKSLTINGYVLTHGHRKVATKKDIIIGHNHPHVKFVDDMGNSYVEPVWVRGMMKNGKRLIWVPAFNELSGAMIVNQDAMRGPIVKNMVENRSHVFLLDGTDIGTIEMLKKSLKAKS